MDKVSKPRTAQACNQCRLLKARCLPSEQAGICEKCLKSQKQCVFTQRARAASRRPRSRVVQLESKLDGLIAMLEQPRKNSKDPIEDLDPLDHPISTTLATECTSLLQPHPLQTVNYRTGHAQSSLTDNGNDCNDRDDESSTCSFVSSAAIEGLIDRGIVDIEECEQLLNLFREMNPYFPFVIIDPRSKVQSFSQDHHFLLLAILATASFANKRLQNILDNELRACLSQMVVFRGEKNLDILQGLLVYLAWFQYHLIPLKQQSYQFLQMAIAMVVDLGLNQSPREAKKQKFGLDLSHHTSDNEDFYSVEARRAYVGCYYLSTSMSRSNLKPSSMHYNDYIMKCAKSLQEGPESPSDTMLLYLAQISKLNEDIIELYEMEKPDIHTESGQLRLQLHVRSFKQQLESWKLSIPTSLQGSCLFQSNYDSTNTKIHEIGLVFGHQPTKPIILSPPLQSTLLNALTSARSSIEKFLCLPTTSYPHLSYPNWGHLIYATFILYKLCLGPPNLLSWDARTARTVVRLDLYLDAICLRLQDVRTPFTAARDMYSMLPAIFTSVRDAYAVLRDEAKPDIACSPHAAVLHPKTRAKRKKAARMACPALAAWGGRSETVAMEVEAGIGTSGKNLGCVASSEGWLLDGDGLLAGMEGMDGVDLFEQMGHDQELWGIGDV